MMNTSGSTQKEAVVTVTRFPYSMLLLFQTSNSPSTLTLKYPIMMTLKRHQIRGCIGQSRTFISRLVPPEGLETYTEEHGILLGVQ